MNTVKVRAARSVVAAFAGAFVIGAALTGCTTHNNNTSTTSPTASPNASSAQATLENEMLQNGINQAGKADYDDATSTFKAILAIDPKSVYALYNLGLIAQIKNNASQAISYYNQALAVNPKFTSALYNKAIVLEPTDRKQAESIYEQIVKINPKASTSFLRLSFLYQEDGNTAKAAAARASALAIDPSLATVSPSPAPSK